MNLKRTQKNNPLYGLRTLFTGSRPEQAVPFFLLALLLIMALLLPSHGNARQLQESDFYSISPMPVPDGIVLEAGGLTFDEEGKLAVPTRRGDIWMITDPGSSNPGFERFASGLHEPLGIAYREGVYYVAHRGELVRITDRDDDGKADLFESVYRWPITGNYHEYSYGPKFLPDGDMIVTLNLSWEGRGVSLSPWRGWMLKITEEGEMTPYATGLRSPLGMGINKEGDIFYAENQGDWISTGWVTHLEEGDFAGNPEGLKWTGLPGSPLDLKPEAIDDSRGLTLHEYSREIPELKAPAVMLPHTIMGISTADLLLIENDDQVGPYTGQFLVADQGHSKIMRLFMEKVKEEYQGAVFGFREGFSSGVIKLSWGPEDDIYVAMTSRGWPATGQQPYGIDRMSWNGEIPFEMKSIEAESNGFTIRFTHPVDAETAGNAGNYRVTDFTYHYHRKYGSPAINRESKAVTDAEVADDLMSVRLYVHGLREGYINEVRAEGVQSGENRGLLHPTAYYTLNNIPDGPAHELDSVEVPDADIAAEERGTGYNKKITEMPADWDGEADLGIEVGTETGLRFDTELIEAEAGSRVALTLTINDDMLHNLVITEPNMADRVGEEAMALGLDGPMLEYAPDMDEILFHTSLLEPGDSQTIYINIPDTPGDYQFICTFPGHHYTMRGILRVR